MEWQKCQNKITMKERTNERNEEKRIQKLDCVAVSPIGIVEESEKLKNKTNFNHNSSIKTNISTIYIYIYELVGAGNGGGGGNKVLILPNGQRGRASERTK